MTRQPLRLYLQILSVFFLFGAFMHLLDLLSLRQSFAGMSEAWQIWTVYLFIMDGIVAAGLYKARRWGLAAFLILATSQLVAYLGFPEIFGRQDLPIGYQTVALAGLALNAFFSFNDVPAETGTH